MSYKRSNTRECNLTLANPLSSILNVQKILAVTKSTTLHHVARCGAMVMDCHLITVLVERWRPETHTFHFSIGEVTVTLQDVAIIWGLHIDGDPLSIDKHHYTADEWSWYYFEFLGFTPLDTDYKSKTRIKLSAISSHLLETEIFDDTDQEIVDQYARGCVLLMLGSYMMSDSSCSHVSLLYLQAMENIAHAGTYSWGSAVLAYLYRELCNAADSKENQYGHGPESRRYNQLIVVIGFCKRLLRVSLVATLDFHLMRPPVASRLASSTHTHRQQPPALWFEFDDGFSAIRVLLASG
ncbi:hypothetical protein ACS0TY_033021 [Phlomoides rotata]